MRYKNGFTLIELLIVIAIIGILSSIVFVANRQALTKAYVARTRAEIRSFSVAMQMYAADFGQFPCDVSRNLPNGLEDYLTSSPRWPSAPWPGSVYDWDYWSPSYTGGCAGTLLADGVPAHNQAVYQISVRFCNASGGDCHFPAESWALGFDSNSSAYWCISGPCRAHGSMPYDHPGCCLGGACPSDQPLCGL